MRRSELVELVGRVAANRLMERHGGTRPWIPKPHPRDRRNRDILEALRAPSRRWPGRTATYEEVASSFGLSPRQVKRIASRTT